MKPFIVCEKCMSSVQVSPADINWYKEARHRKTTFICLDCFKDSRERGGREEMEVIERFNRNTIEGHDFTVIFGGLEDKSVSDVDYFLIHEKGLSNGEAEQRKNYFVNRLDGMVANSKIISRLAALTFKIKVHGNHAHEVVLVDAELNENGKPTILVRMDFEELRKRNKVHYAIETTEKVNYLGNIVVCATATFYDAEGKLIPGSLFSKNITLSLIDKILGVSIKEKVRSDLTELESKAKRKADELQSIQYLVRGVTEKERELVIWEVGKDE